MDWMNRSVSNYQQIIGAYEKQVWERSLEESFLRSLNNSTRKRAKVNSDLIDVDLVRGSTFSKAKPQQGWTLIVRRTLLRALLLPFNCQWWKSCTCWWFFWVLTVLYVLQISSFIIYFTDPGPSLSAAESLSLTHVLSPLLMLIAITCVQTKIVEPLLGPPSQVDCCQTRREKIRRRIESPGGHHSVSEQDSVGSRDTGIDLNPDDVGADNSSNCQSATQALKSFDSLHELDVPLSDTNDSEMVPDNVTAHHVTDADDESDEACVVPKEWLHKQPSSRKASFEKTSAWLLQHAVKSPKTVHGSGGGGILYSADSQTSGVFQNEHGEADLENGLDQLHGSRLYLHQYSQNSLSFSSCSLPEEEKSLNHISKNVRRSNSFGCQGVRCRRMPDSVPNCDGQNNNDGTLQSNPLFSKQKCSLKAGINEVALMEVRRGYNGRDILSQDILEHESSSMSEIPSNASVDSVSKSFPDSKWCTDRAFQSTNERQSGRLLNHSGSGKSMKRQRECSSQMVSENKVSDRAGKDALAMRGAEVISTPGSSASEFSDNEMAPSDDNEELGVDLGPNLQSRSSIVNNLASKNSQVSCMIWESENVQKVDMTVIDIGWGIIQKVENSPESCDYIVLGIAFSVLLMLTPIIYRLFHSRDQLEKLNLCTVSDVRVLQLAFGHNWRQLFVIISGVLQRFCLGLVIFFLLAVAERTFRQRLLFAKHFSYLTSSRRTKKYDLPHFRLNKVQNIKTWLSLRSFLKRHGAQRSVETIVSDAFLAAVVIISIISIELLQDHTSFLDDLGNWELTVWCLSLGIYLMRFITLGCKINRKYCNFPVLITEQINLYLHMEQKPHKKEELMMANSVLKLAEDLLKELDSPFKVSGLSANPFLYNITKVVVLSAFSAVLTELLGFKLKLHKIKIRA